VKRKQLIQDFKDLQSTLRSSQARCKDLQIMLKQHLQVYRTGCAPRSIADDGDGSLRRLTETCHAPTSDDRAGQVGKDDGDIDGKGSMALLAEIHAHEWTENAVHSDDLASKHDGNDDGDIDGKGSNMAPLAASTHVETEHAANSDDRAGQGDIGGNDIDDKGSMAPLAASSAPSHVENELAVDSDDLASKQDGIGGSDFDGKGEKVPLAAACLPPVDEEEDVLVIHYGGRLMRMATLEMPGFSHDDSMKDKSCELQGQELSVGASNSSRPSAASAGPVYLPNPMSA
jgi:hypothetical protein